MTLLFHVIQTCVSKWTLGETVKEKAKNISPKSTQVYQNRMFQRTLKFPLWNAILQNYRRNNLSISETVEVNMENTFLTR